MPVSTADMTDEQRLPLQSEVAYYLQAKVPVRNIADRLDLSASTVHNWRNSIRKGKDLPDYIPTEDDKQFVRAFGEGRMNGDAEHAVDEAVAEPQDVHEGQPTLDLDVIREEGPVEPTAEPSARASAALSAVRSELADTKAMLELSVVDLKEMRNRLDEAEKENATLQAKNERLTERLGEAEETARDQEERADSYRDALTRALTELMERKR